MTHLPECPAINYFGLHARTACICSALRSYEQRVRKSLWQECYDAAMQTTERNYVWHEKRGYAAGLDAAEKSVLASWSWLDWEDDGKGEQEVMFMRDAVAAIRALREEK